MARSNLRALARGRQGIGVLPLPAAHERTTSEIVDVRRFLVTPEIEAMVPDKDFGFVPAGQKAMVKFGTKACRWASVAL